MAQATEFGGLRNDAYPIHGLSQRATKKPLQARGYSGYYKAGKAGTEVASPCTGHGSGG